jgi:hypothetical protein
VIFRVLRIVVKCSCFDTPCRAILKKQRCLFPKTENRKVKQVLFGGWYQWEGRGYKERVKEAECSGNIMYLCMKVKNETC